jgi:hypothetical protein
LVWPAPEKAKSAKFEQTCLLAILKQTKNLHRSLVVVHGLAGGSLSTWTHENGPCWLEWLSEELPEFRIFVFGYPAQSVYFKSSEEGVTGGGRVFTFAENLCIGLKDLRGKVCCLRPWQPHS